ncbi:MAG: biotin/lipoyl-binding protein [Dehalococcoidia bacterium]|nr:biotin/lipoyl-binding protein [Dehalococcoidia bacterium]
MFGAVLVANRGEIAVRIVRTLRRIGVRAVVAASPADRDGLAAREADAVALLRGSPPAESYLDGEQLIAAARVHGCAAIHPGYGFLAESAAFARACAAAGIVFIGPPPEAMEALGDKARARQFAARLGIPVVPGFDGDGDDAALLTAAEAVGFPLLIKARAGGGGRGMRLARTPGELAGLLAEARREAKAAFGDGGLLLERLVERPRHIEVQVLADRHGTVLHLWERECSVQRRRQKLVEEAPSPAVDAALRAELTEAAVRLAREAGYVNAGTVEFLVGEPGRDGRRPWYFLEVNPRLQVEHPVTEAITGLDLVELQVRIAAGEPLPFGQEEVELRGHAIEFRINAEDPQEGFRPTGGDVRWWPGAATVGWRIDAGYADGDRVPGYYDSLAAKVVVHGHDREDALRLGRGVPPGLIETPRTTAPLVQVLAGDPEFVRGAVHVEWLEARLPELLARAGAPEGAWAAAAGAAAGLAPRAGAFAGPAWIGAGRAALWLTDGWTARDALAVEGGAERFRARASGGRLVVEGPSGELWTFWPAWPAPPARRVDGEGGPAGTAAVAPLAGTIAAVLVQPGQEVAAGQVLAVIHAMKMEHPVRADADGRVAEVCTAPGATVAAGEVLVRLEVRA